MDMVTPMGMIITVGPLMDTDTATVIKGTATAIEDTALALDLGSRSYRGASRGLATIMAPLMESWDHKPDAPFGPTNVRMTN
jgi:acetyl-CoA acetyltransferase